MTCDRVLQKGKVRWGLKFSLLNSWRVKCCLKYIRKVEKWIFQKNLCVLSVKEFKFSQLTHIEIELKGINVVSDKSRDLCTWFRDLSVENRNWNYLCARISSLTTLTLTYSCNFWARTSVLTKRPSSERNVRFWSSEQRLTRFQDRKRMIFQSTAFASVAPSYKDKFFVKFPVRWLIIFLLVCHPCAIAIYTTTQVIVKERMNSF